MYLAPSWSWAGVHGRLVSFGPQSQYDTITPFAKVLNIDIQLSHQDPFGAVAGGSITLDGPLLRLGTVDSLNAPQSPPPYPNLMTDISTFLKDPVADGYGKNARAQQVGLLMLLRWREAGGRTERVCFLVLLGVDGEESWRRVTLLELKTKAPLAGTDRITTEKSQAVLREIREDMRKETVRII